MNLKYMESKESNHEATIVNIKTTTHNLNIVTAFCYWVVSKSKEFPDKFDAKTVGAAELLFDLAVKIKHEEESKLISLINQTTK